MNKKFFKRCFILFTMMCLSFLATLILNVKVSKATNDFTLTKNTEEYVRNVTISVDFTDEDYNDSPKYVCFLAGEHEEGDFDCNLNSSNRINVHQNHGQFTVSLSGKYTVFAQYYSGNTTLKTIEVNNIDDTADTIILKQRKVNDKLNHIIIDISIENTQSPLVLMKYLSNKRSVDDFQEYGTVLEDMTTLIVNKAGIYTVYVKDKAGNEAVQDITIATSTLKYGKKSMSISPADQITYLVKESEGTYYIELPKANEEIKYKKGKVIVLSLESSHEENTYETLKNTQAYKNYIELTSSMVSNLNNDRYIITIDPSIISGIYEEGNTYIVANYITRKQARRLGFDIRLIETNIIIIAVGVVSVIVFIFIINRIRVKKSSIDD